MNTIPPVLWELAAQSLLRNEDLALSTLEVLSSKFFPLLFKEAFKRKSAKLLSAILQVWPYPGLPLGALMKKRTTRLEPEVELVLYEIDMLLDKKIHFRKCKLEVLDLRTVGQDWNESGLLAEDSISQTMSENQAVLDNPDVAVKQPLKVLIELELNLRPSGSLLSFFLRWAERRKGLLQIHCNKLKISSFSLYIYQNLSERLHLDSTEILNVNCNNSPRFLLDFAPYLGCMDELHTLLLQNIHEDEDIFSEKQKIISMLILQLPKLECLRRLHMNDVPFLEGHLPRMLGSLKTELEMLSMSYYNISESEWRLLPELPCISRLMQLNLTNVNFSHLSPKPLQDLLVKIAPTLRTLIMEDCGIVDAQLKDIIPFLSRCSKLRRLYLLGNKISMSTLKNLAHHTSKMTQLREEQYPIPLESYGNFGIPSYDTVKQHCAELMDILMSTRKLKVVCFGSDRCSQCNKRYIYQKEDAGLCACWTRP